MGQEFVKTHFLRQQEQSLKNKPRYLGCYEKNVFNRSLNRPDLDQLGKSLEAAVIGPFHGIREATGRKLAHVEMVAQALAADALARTPAIAAIAPFQIG